eukprot:TRINITY_DN8004_c0_g1_i1.p2 TRINITY_DN8004_c0_g1~~TRINITY_DN8004_c0_g1_i1.p2  ORF type:complete len:152 (+),score=19.59 TRINITY_DN8004_c0_g1_i1:432-887(+)
MVYPGGRELGLRSPPSRGGFNASPGFSTPPPRMMRDSAARFMSPRTSGAVAPASAARAGRHLLGGSVLPIDVDADGSVIDVDSCDKMAMAGSVVAAAAPSVSVDVQLDDVWLAPSEKAWVSASENNGANNAGGRRNFTGATTPPRTGCAVG